MSAFLYYFPGFPKPLAVASEIPAESNLAPILGDSKFSRVQVVNGPEGTAGWLIAIHPGPKGAAAKCGYYPDAQRWAKVRGADGKVTHWIGWEKDNPPSPADLARPRMVDGHPVRLTDGREWIIPAVHVPLTTLPRVFGVDESGCVGLQITPGYEEICRESAEWWQVLEDGKPFGKLEWFEFTCKLLALNYRLGKHEIGTLGLLNDSQAILQGVLFAAIGVPAVIAENEAQKKILQNTQLDGSQVSPGGEA